ncbi:MAG: LptE family protein [Nitrospira sp.]|nr:LptE family protein [Nitrospira sp.]
MKFTYPIIIVFIFLVSSCGYQFAERGVHIPATVRSISIPVFKNKTMEPILEEEITSEVIRGFINDRRLEVADKSVSDLILYGSITSYKESPLSFDKSQNSLENRITVTVHIKLRQQSAENPLLEIDMTKNAEYSVSSDVMLTRAAKLSAIKELARNLSEEISDRILWGW